jgi:hypothetical protein
MRNRRRLFVILAALGIAVAILSQMPPSLDDPTAYPELNRYARPMPAEVDALLPGGLCDTLQANLHALVDTTLSAPYNQRVEWYDQVLQVRSELTKYGCTTP